MQNPYRITGPAIIQFSGGRTSGYLLKHILDANDGALPPDVHVAFQNTGKEKNETLDFVQECGERWNVKITWLEYRHEPGRHYYEIVSHNSASRNGEPFQQLIRALGYLPNPVSSFCSIELKIRTCYRWVRNTFGWDHWDTVIGLRADEPRRLAKAKARAESGKDRFAAVMPLAAAGVTRHGVVDWWREQPFDLRLLSVDGKTPDGNCDNCFKKGLPNLLGRARRDPDSFAWWIGEEAAATEFAKEPSGARFRMDRPSYAKILKMAQDQFDMIGDDIAESVDCPCTD